MRESRLPVRERLAIFVYLKLRPYMRRTFPTACAVALAVACAQPTDPIGCVDPFVGTGFHGHTYPGATTPFGMVQLSPDTRAGDWDACAGYHYDDATIDGFSHTHLSGTGCADLADILFHPTTRADAVREGEYVHVPYGSRTTTNRLRAVITPCRCPAKASASN